MSNKEDTDFILNIESFRQIIKVPSVTVSYIFPTQIHDIPFLSVLIYFINVPKYFWKRYKVWLGALIRNFVRWLVNYMTFFSAKVIINRRLLSAGFNAMSDLTHTCMRGGSFLRRRVCVETILHAILHAANADDMLRAGHFRYFWIF